MEALSDEELLHIPDANLAPGELARAFTVRAEWHVKQEQLAEQRVAHVMAVQRTQEAADAEDLHRREDRLLQQVQEREKEITEHYEELDRRTIKLADGRRAYVDGDGFRDGQGRELTGADKAQAEQGHLAQPDAATWQEKVKLDKQWNETESTRQKVEAVQQGRAGEADLTSAEKDFQAKAEQRQAEIKTVPDYGSGNLAELDGLSASFNPAAAGQNTESKAFSVSRETQITSKPSGPDAVTPL